MVVVPVTGSRFVFEVQSRNEVDTIVGRQRLFEIEATALIRHICVGKPAGVCDKVT